MFTFIKKLFGLDQATMKEAGVQIEQVPYKVETSPVLEIIPAAAPSPVNPQITDAVTTTQEPAKKVRKPRAPKDQVSEKPAAKKAALVKKAAAITATSKKPRSKKV